MLSTLPASRTRQMNSFTKNCTWIYLRHHSGPPRWIVRRGQTLESLELVPSQSPAAGFTAVSMVSFFQCWPEVPPAAAAAATVTSTVFICLFIVSSQFLHNRATVNTCLLANQQVFRTKGSTMEKSIIMQEWLEEFLWTFWCSNCLSMLITASILWQGASYKLFKSSFQAWSQRVFDILRRQIFQWSVVEL